MGKKLLLVVATFAVIVVAGMGASAASAGEVTGNCSPNTKNAKAADNCKDDYSQGNSICSFSGQNDYPDGSASGPPGRVQSYGQNVKAGRNDPSHGGFNPGDACQGGN